MPLPLIAVAMGSGIVRGAVGAITAHNNAQRRKGLIGQAYGLSNDRLHHEQADVREGTEEGLVARGLNQGGQDPNTISGGVRTDLTKQFALEQKDLDFQRDAALSENKADRITGIIGAALGGAQTAANVYGAGKELGAMRGSGGSAPDAPPIAATPSATPAGNTYPAVTPPTSIRGAFGISPVDPLGDPSSAWYREHPGFPGAPADSYTRLAMGESNADFNVGS